MMAAMMLPSVAPMVLAFSRISHERSATGTHYVPTWVFVGGYLLAWAAYGVAAAGVFRALTGSIRASSRGTRGGPWIAGGAIVAAGLYQPPPAQARLSIALPDAAALHSPWLEGGWSGALKMGLSTAPTASGVAGLMLILFALGDEARVLDRHRGRDHLR